MTAYGPIDFPFQVHNDAVFPETAYLVPEGLPHGTTLEVTPRQARISPGQAAIFSCRLTVDPAVVRPGCSNDQGFRLTAWRVAEDADQRWGSCFYFLRPRVRTRLELGKADWTEQRLTVDGRLSIDSDESVEFAAQLPLRVRIRLETDLGESPLLAWVNADLQPSGAFVLQLPGVAGPHGATMGVQAWFDRTDLLASSRSDVLEAVHWVAPVIG